MKKLISLLASFSLITSSSVAVIACGTDEEDVIDNTAEISKLIDDFRVDLQLLTDQFWNLKNDNFFDVVDDSNSVYTFLNEEIISSLVDENLGQPVIGDSLTTQEKQYLIADIEKILSPDELKKYFEDNIDQEKYALLIEDVDFYNGFTPSWSSLEINYTNDNGQWNNEETSNFTSYVSLNLDLNFTYIDYNDEITTWSLQQKFIFTLTTDGVLVESIKNLEQNITYDYYLSGEEYSWIDASDFGYSTDEQIAKIFKQTDDDFKSIYKNNSAFSTNIIAFMKKNYFSQFNTIPLQFTDTNIFNSFTSFNYINAEANGNTYNLSTAFGSGFYDTIFSDIVDNETSFLFNDQNRKINSYLYNYLKDNYMNFYNSYYLWNESKLQEMQSQIGQELNESKQLAFDNSIRTGWLKLDNLAIKVNDSYSHPINDFSIFVSMAVNNEETQENREEYTKSYLFGAMYYNLQLGIQTFQDVFDIQPREETDNFLPIARFSGQGISASGELDNIWNNIQVFDTLVKYISASLSLIFPDVTKHRDILLEQGRQNNYEWNLQPTETPVTTRTGLLKTDQGIITNSIYLQGDSLLIWNFKQNFINASFIIEAPWTERNLVVIEKTAKQ